MITKEIIDELKESNDRMRKMLSELTFYSMDEIQALRCELLKTLELLPTESHDDRNSRCC